MENFYYETIHDVLKLPLYHEEKSITLKRLKVKITRLHHLEQQKKLLDSAEGDYMDSEEPSLYHFLREETMRHTYCSTC
jgi:hypothetical protein